MSAKKLLKNIKQLLPDAELKQVTMPQTSEIKLWLIDELIMARPLTESEIDAVWQAPAYWAFAWASGQVLAGLILNEPERVKGKTVLDFGAGSGLVAIAAAMAGAQKIIACDLDPDALDACRANAELNGVTIETLDNFYELKTSVDILFAADVLYDWENKPLLPQFLEAATEVIVADSRVKDFSEKGYRYNGTFEAVTLPDMGELEEFKQVKIFLSLTF